MARLKQLRNNKNPLIFLVNNERGFTLVEMIFVLSIVFTLTIMMIPFGSKWMQEKTEEAAIDLFVATVYNLQSYSIAHDNYTRLHFIEKDGQTYYVAEVPGEQVLGEYKLPDGMGLSSSNRLRTVEFHGDGNIVQSGVLTLVTQTRRFAITFQFQRGRMIIRESERVLLDGGDFNNNGLVNHFQHLITNRNTNYDEFASEKTLDARC